MALSQGTPPCCSCWLLLLLCPTCHKLACWVSYTATHLQPCLWLGCWAPCLLLPPVGTHSSAQHGRNSRACPLCAPLPCRHATADCTAGAPAEPVRRGGSCTPLGCSHHSARSAGSCRTQPPPLQLWASVQQAVAAAARGRQQATAWGPAAQRLPRTWQQVGLWVGHAAAGHDWALLLPPSCWRRPAVQASAGLGHHPLLLLLPWLCWMAAFVAGCHVHCVGAKAQLRLLYQPRWWLGWALPGPRQGCLPAAGTPLGWVALAPAAHPAAAAPAACPAAAAAAAAAVAAAAVAAVAAAAVAVAAPTVAAAVAAAEAGARHLPAGLVPVHGVVPLPIAPAPLPCCLGAAEWPAAKQQRMQLHYCCCWHPAGCWCLMAWCQPRRGPPGAAATGWAPLENHSAGA
jgi:hypothetical protein